MNLAIVDDDSLVVQFLSEHLNKEDNINVVTKHHSGDDFISFLESGKIEVDIVILDLKMKRGDGIQTLRKMKIDFPLVKIVVLSSYYKPNYVGFFLKEGAHAFFSKSVDKKTIVLALNEVFENGHYCTPEQFDIIRKQVNSKTSPDVQTENVDFLSERELDVLKLLCQQLTAKEIASNLFISIKTVEAHKSNLLLKTGARNTSGLVIFAVKHHVFDPNDTVIFN